MKVKWQYVGAVALLLLCVPGCETESQRIAREKKEAEQRIISTWVGAIAGALGGAIRGARQGWNRDPS